VGGAGDKNVEYRMSKVESQDYSGPNFEPRNRKQLNVKENDRGHDIQMLIF
jgi:hypothetical protein